MRDARISYDSRLWDDVRGCGGYITVTTDEGNIVVASADVGNIISAEAKYIPTVNTDWVGDSIGVPDDVRDALDELAQRVTTGGL